MTPAKMELVKYQTEHGEVVLSQEIIRAYLVPKDSRVTDQEIGLFLKLCQFQQLNPFLREVYLIKYGDYPATMVTGKEVFSKRAQKDPNFDGVECGITVMNKDGKLERREGSLFMTGETLIGGWARVYKKHVRTPFFDEVSMIEYAARKNDGTLTGMWSTKPATMIRKVAYVHALREAYPELFEGLYSQEEINTIDASKLPLEPVKMAEDVKVETPDVPETTTETVVSTPEIVSAVMPEPEEDEEVQTDEDPDGSYIFGFGKHKGSTLRHIAETDYGWLVWYLKNGSFKDVKDIIARFLKTFVRPVHAKKAKPVEDDYPLPFDLHDDD